MTVQAMPWAIQGQSHPAENARNFVAAMFGAPVAALVEGVSITTAGGAHGVVGATDLAVSQNGGGNMSVNVAAGRAVIRSTEAASLLAGAYTFLNDGTVNLVIAAADPTNPRIDIVIAQVRDSNYSGASTDARLTVVTGTPAGSPAVPAVPDSCVVLAQVAVAALASSITNANITDKRTRAYALGGVAVCTSTTLPSGASLYPGLMAYETDNKVYVWYDGTAWRGEWTAFTSQIDQGASSNIAKTTVYGQYRYDGPMIDYHWQYDLTAGGTAGSALTVTLPVATVEPTGPILGAGLVYDTSSNLFYQVSWAQNTTTTVKANPDGVGAAGWGAVPNLALGTGDSLRGNLRYRWV